jgi:hypothetical protein
MSEFLDCTISAKEKLTVAVFGGSSSPRGGRGVGEEIVVEVGDGSEEDVVVDTAEVEVEGMETVSVMLGSSLSTVDPVDAGLDVADGSVVEGRSTGSTVEVVVETVGLVELPEAVPGVDIGEQTAVPIAPSDDEGERGKGQVVEDNELIRHE